MTGSIPDSNDIGTLILLITSSPNFVDLLLRDECIADTTESALATAEYAASPDKQRRHALAVSKKPASWGLSNKHLIGLSVVLSLAV